MPVILILRGVLHTAYVFTFLGKNLYVQEYLCHATLLVGLKQISPSLK